MIECPETCPAEGAPSESAGPGRAPTRRVAVLLAAAVALVGLVWAEPAVAAPAQGGGIDRIDVSLGDQRARVWSRDGTLIKDIPVSTGSRGRTPSGSFRVYNRLANTVSTLDHVSRMKWMVSFYGGIGFHGIPTKNGTPVYTPLGERPVSAGCVRMSDADAEWIYRNVPNGTLVNVK